MRRSHRGRPSILQLPGLTLLAMVRLPRAPFATLVLLVASFTVLLMVGSLCVRHWWLAVRGTTYLGSLKGESISNGGALQCIDLPC